MDKRIELEKVPETINIVFDCIKDGKPLKKDSIVTIYIDGKYVGGGNISDYEGHMSAAITIEELGKKKLVLKYGTPIIEDDVEFVLKDRYKKTVE